MTLEELIIRANKMNPSLNLPMTIRKPIFTEEEIDDLKKFMKSMMTDEEREDVRIEMLALYEQMEMKELNERNNTTE